MLLMTMTIMLTMTGKDHKKDDGEIAPNEDDDNDGSHCSIYSDQPPTGL